MAKKIVTLYIDESSLRLMITDGKQVIKWADLSLEPGLIDSTTVIKEAEFVDKIRQLFEVQKVKDKKIIVGMSGLHCLTRPITLPHLPEAMLDEAVQREAAAVLPVPVEELYISWQTIPAPEEKTQVFLVATPRKTVDNVLQALQQADLKPSFMSLKPLLLARVVKEATAIIVDVQTTEFDIAIMTDGVPQPVRTIPFAKEALPWQDKLTVIRSELDRTITFYNSNNPEKPLASSVPIYASGELANETQLCQSLSDELGYPVLLLSSPLECPEELDLSRYSANIGLVIQKLLSGKEAGPSIINLNALPASYQPKPISLTNIVGLPSAIIVAGLLVFLLMLVQSSSADIESLRTQLNTTDVSLQRMQAQRLKLTENISELERKIVELETSRDSFTTAVSSLEEQTDNFNSDLEVAIESLPSGISLSSISHANSILTISGQAPNTKRVLSYLLKLDTSGRFGDIAITNMNSANTTSGNMTGIQYEDMNFTLLPSLQPPSKWVSSIEAAIGDLPTSIRVTSITSTDGILTINGWTPLESIVLFYLRNLEATGKFLEINIASMTRVEDEGMDFSLIFKLGE
ncbi:PilN domain-containing protein [Chloroflexota bacterium]